MSVTILTLLPWAIKEMSSYVVLLSTKKVLFTNTGISASEGTLPRAIWNCFFIPPRLLALRIQYTRHVVIFNGIIYRDMSAMHKTRLKLPFKS